MFQFIILGTLEQVAQLTADHVGPGRHHVAEKPGQGGADGAASGSANGANNAKGGQNYPPVRTDLVTTAQVTPNIPYPIGSMAPCDHNAAACAALLGLALGATRGCKDCPPREPYNV